MRILITGGAGFIGSHSVDLFLENGFEVVVFDNLSTGYKKYLNLAHPRLRFVEADILNYPALLAEMNNCDAVLHLAAISSVPKSIEDPIFSLQTNTQGFLHVLQAIRETKRPIRLVYASSAAIYGSAAELPCCDDAPLPLVLLSPYALEKASNERYANLYSRLFGIKSLGLRYFNVYGVRQDPASPYTGVIAKFIDSYQADNAITIFGDGEQSRDFIHVSDVVRANLAAINSDFNGVLNIATGVPETLTNIASYIGAIGEKPPKINFAAPRTGDILKSYAKTEKAKFHLDFCFKTNLKEGMRSLLLPGDQ